MNESEKRPGTVQITHTVSPWGTVLAQLAQASGLSEEQVSDAVSKGGVWRKKHNGHKLRRIRDLSDGADISDQFYLNYDPAVLAQIPLSPSLVSDQLNYSIWNKPSGMLSQGSKWSDHCTITATVQHQLGKPTLLVHRLDKAASGLMVVAHTKNAVRKLSELFASQSVEKQYTVVIHGAFKFALPHRLEMPVQGKDAITDVLEKHYDESTDTCTLKVRILTGRKHQIRSHLQSIGVPVVGDRLFDPDRNHTQDLQLTASLLGFDCPFTNEKLCFRA